MNNIYKKILAPIDGSKNSFTSLAHAASIAAAFNAELGILFVKTAVQQIPMVAQLNDVYMPEALGNKLLNDNYMHEDIITHVNSSDTNVIQEALSKVPEGVNVKAFEELGSPAIIIPEFAEENGYDLIVIGSRGLGVLKGLVLGSVSAYVVNHASCPVVVVKTQ